MSCRLLLVLLVTAGWGCSATIVLPEEEGPEVPRSVYVVEHGWHTSLVLTDQQDRMIRYVYGDWRWYAKAETGFLRAFPTLFVRTQGALGRRQLPAPAAPATLRAHLSVAIDEIHTLSASAARVDALIRRLDARFAASSDTLVYSELYDLEFVHDDRPYLLGRNSNHVLAGWLDELGIQVSGNPVFGRWHVTQR